MKYFIKYDLFPIVAIIYTFFCFVGFIVGLLNSPMREGGCHYSSIASRINLGYVVSCEFFKEHLTSLLT